ncbi:MAG TPA: serine hydrolase domain-containing protein [Candidatus Dormibacteraeota bacterium]|jgi:D-alanyl-D-alanine carboxypeptidase|nr:serine hydrolase domain-containing protein [Candidatus Dormibacteraeota bacterium]
MIANAWQRRALAIVIVAATTAFAATGQQMPEPPAAKQFMTWLAAFNGGDRATLKEFLEKNYPERAKDIDGELGFREMTGGFELKKAEESTSTKFTALVKEKDSDQFARATIEVEEAEPHRIKELDLRTCPTPAEFKVARMSESEVIAGVKKLAESRAAADKFSGAVTISKNGKTIFAQAYGLSDREKKTPNTPATQFRMGSMNKMFTATSILQLVQAGKIKLNDPLEKYLTDYPNKDVATKVTIHHLLTHTGGTGDFFGPEFDKHRLELKTLQDYVKLYGARGLEFEPGSKWSYSNYGFLLLGIVVEKASGQDYYAYVREHIFKPAGMASSDSLPEGEAVPGRSVGYTKMDSSKTWTPNTDTLPYRGTSAGGGYTTVEDLQRFASALINHKLLDAEHTELLTTGHEKTPRGNKYAYGFMDNVEDGVRWFGHGGGAPGMNGDLRIFPKSGYVIAVLANMDPPAAERIASYTSDRLPEK